jgi:hypothetical protein
LATEGSYATWNVENGVYEITYSLSTSENDFDHDAVYFFDGTELSLFASRSDATIPSSSRRWVSEIATQQVEVTKEQLTLATVDTVDKWGATQLRINQIEKVGELEEREQGNIHNSSITHNYSDPVTGLNLGTLKPGETDTNTGTTYQQDYNYPTDHLGHSYIEDFIGGDDADYVNFTLDESSYLNFYHSGAIAKILDSDNQVIASSDDSYSGNLQAYLVPGNYAIGFSSESCIPELFNEIITVVPEF